MFFHRPQIHSTEDIIMTFQSKTTFSIGDTAKMSGRAKSKYVTGKQKATFPKPFGSYPVIGRFNGRMVLRPEQARGLSSCLKV